MNKLVLLSAGILFLFAACSKDEPLYTKQAPVAAISKDTLTGLSIYPNPFSSQLNISFDLSASDSVAYHIFDMQGRARVSERFVAAKSRSNLSLQLDTLPQGLYLLQLEAYGERYTTKIVKVN